MEKTLNDSLLFLLTATVCWLVGWWFGWLVSCLFFVYLSVSLFNNLTTHLYKWGECVSLMI